MLLTDEEIRKIRTDIYDDPTLVEDLIGDYDKVIAKAQLKKVVELLPEDCTEHKHTVMMLGKEVEVDVSRCDCPDCWQALLKEVE